MWSCGTPVVPPVATIRSAIKSRTLLVPQDSLSIVLCVFVIVTEYFVVMNENNVGLACIILDSTLGEAFPLISNGNSPCIIFDNALWFLLLVCYPI